MNKGIIRFAASVLSAGMFLTMGTLMATPEKVNAAELGDKVDLIDLAPENGEEAIKEFVSRLYRICLDREPDAAGLKSWVDPLKNNEATGICVAFGFIYSNEFQSKNLSNEQYITYMYNAFLGRTPDAQGLNDWLDAMKKGATREDIFKGFAESPEFSNACAACGIVRGDYYVGVNVQTTSSVNLFVDRLYKYVLNRTCDPAGMTAWSQALISHAGSGAQVAYGMVFSPEFMNRSLCNDCYVDILYKSFLNRNAAPSEIKAWADALNQGASRETVFNGFVGSDEFTGICANYGIDRGASNFTGATTAGAGTCKCGKVYAQGTFIAQVDYTEAFIKKFGDIKPVGTLYIEVTLVLVDGKITMFIDTNKYEESIVKFATDNADRLIQFKTGKTTAEVAKSLGVSEDETRNLFVALVREKLKTTGAKVEGTYTISGGNVVTSVAGKSAKGAIGNNTVTFDGSQLGLNEYLLEGEVVFKHV